MLLCWRLRNRSKLQPMVPATIASTAHALLQLYSIRSPPSFFSLFFSFREKNNNMVEVYTYINLPRQPEMQMKRVWICSHHHGKTCSEIRPNGDARREGRRWASPSWAKWKQWQRQKQQAQSSWWQCCCTCKPSSWTSAKKRFILSIWSRQRQLNLIQKYLHES